MLKVDSDPAQVIVNHASFRVKLASAQRPSTVRIPAMSGAGGTARRRAPVVWSGKSEPGDPGATRLLQAVRNSSVLPPRGGYHDVPERGYDTGATQVIPRLDLDDDSTMPTPLVGGGRPRTAGAPLLPPMRQAVGAYDLPEPEPYDTADLGLGRGFGGDFTDRSRPQRHAAGGARAADAATVRHAYYPGRRMNLGVVLLPLRVFLGFISIYAGMGKLCDPVYFDGGERGSMVKWLNSLHPWALAEPLRDFALSHPVGAGLSISFLQIVAGVLTVLGLWQRVAACLGALLSAALLLTVSWHTVPAYDAPDIIYLAAWSPLIIAGAPVYSIDGRLAGEAWRKLGPRSDIWDLRSHVLRRGAAVATVVIGLTLLIGSVLGGAVRSSDMVTVPGPNHDPVNQLPGVPLPETPRGGRSSAPGGDTKSGKPSEPSATSSGSPSAEQSTPDQGGVRETGGAGTGQSRQQPSETQGTGREPSQPVEQAPPPSSSQGPSSSGGPGDGGGSGGGDGGGSGGGSSSGGSNSNPIGGLLG
ncbi:DoxX family membrane protein [Streptomyces sp. NPDC006923]|uniref:DoxX family protein n=1 Tax=Streptomyces sp. NPDC006923 TaxID=3155355 RepID=UPI0033C97A0E